MTIELLSEPQRHRYTSVILDGGVKTKIAAGGTAARVPVRRSDTIGSVTPNRYAEVELEVEEEDFTLLEELSLFLLSLFDSDLESEDFSPSRPLDSPFWPLRA